MELDVKTGGLWVSGYGLQKSLAIRKTSDRKQEEMIP